LAQYLVSTQEEQGVSLSGLSFLPLPFIIEATTVIFTALHAATIMDWMIAQRDE